MALFFFNHNLNLIVISIKDKNWMKTTIFGSKE